MKIQMKYFILASVAAAIVALDQATKLYIHTQFQLGESLVVFKDFFNITYVRNTGAAFGLFRNSHELFRTLFFMSIPPIALLIILTILRNVANNDRIQIFALSCVFGGAVGNYLDRLRFGYVIDFVDVHWREFYKWPAFNVADSAIVIGIILLIGIMVMRGNEEA